MRAVLELPNVHDRVLIPHNGSFVAIRIKIVRGREEGNQSGELVLFMLPVHLVSVRVSACSMSLPWSLHTQGPEPHEPE